MSKKAFNKITDLRPYLLQHPDQEMVREACLHYLGDEVQEFYYGQKKSHEKEAIKQHFHDLFRQGEY